MPTPFAESKGYTEDANKQWHKDGKYAQSLENEYRSVHPEIQSYLDRVHERNNKDPLDAIRQEAVRKAWKEELKLIEETGRGTREWTEVKMQELLERKGFRV